MAEPTITSTTGNLDGRSIIMRSSGMILAPVLPRGRDLDSSVDLHVESVRFSSSFCTGTCEVEADTKLF